jgi:hypothetical protein
MLKILIPFVAVFLPAVAGAQTYMNRLDGLAFVGINIIDSVGKRCWPRPKETANEVESELVRKKIFVGGPFSSMTVMYLKATGRKITRGAQKNHSGDCIFSADLYVSDCALYKASYGKFPKFGCYTIWKSAGSLSIVRKGKAQSEINKLLVGFTRKFLYDLEMDRLGKRRAER